MAKSKSKRPVAGQKPQVRKEPRTPWFETLEDQNPLWSFALADLRGPWSFGQMKGQELAGVVARLKSLESMSWTEIEQGTKSHFIPRNEITAQAQKRLEKITLEDIERLFSLRMKGKPRIWGLRVRNILRIIWWDPNHEVCPSAKR